jgi:hypothetical protein
MKIKVLLGSLGAVAILILVSFTNVVGIQSTTSDSINDSPLFSIRTNKATNNENNRVLTSNYLGKGFNVLSFPCRDTNAELIQKFIDRIRTMDDDTFYRFIDYAVNQINHNPKLKNINSQGVIAVLYQLKNNQHILPNQNIELDEKANWLPSTGTNEVICLIENIITFIIWSIFYAFEIILDGLNSILKKENCFSFMTGCTECPEFQGQANRYLYNPDMS